MPCIPFKIGDCCGILTVAGPTFKISVGRKIFDFEWHSYCGPSALNKRGDPLRHQPTAFLNAASLWNQQGRKVDEKTGLWAPAKAFGPITGR